MRLGYDVIRSPGPESSQVTSYPLDRLDEWLPESVRAVVERDTPIPTVAQRAAGIARDDASFVRADIGQISGLDAELEVLYGPPVGLEELRVAVAELWTRTFAIESLRLTARNVAITTGAAEALSLLFRCFAHGRTVALPRGHWENYRNGVELAGGVVRVVDYFDADGALDTHGLARAIREHDIAVLLANFPCNPTGAVLNDDEAAALASLTRETDVILIADEVYSRLRFDGHAPVSLLAHAPERTIVVSSASKEYLIPGARVGFAISANEAVTDRVLRKLIRAGTASPNVLGQRRLLELLGHDLEDLRAGRDPALIARIRDELKERKESLVAVLRHHGMAPVGRPGHDPQGTIFLMAALPGWFSGNDEEFVETALDRRAFSAIPGSAFGLPGSIRLSFGGLTADAIQRLDAALKRWRESF